MIGALGAAGGLALLTNMGIEIPAIGAVGEAGTLGLAAYALDKFGIVRSRLLRHAATGLLAIAVFEGVKKSGLGSKGVHGAPVDGYDAGYSAD